MPYALSTTKRKFHQILDSISNASSTSLALKDDRNNASTITLPSNLETQAKKPRLTRPLSALVPSTTLNAANQVSALRTITRKSISPTMNGESKPPNFAPWDRTQFLGRLETFRHVSSWMGKPEKINEVQWAKRGWSCVGKERVGCRGGCGNEVVVKLEDDGEQVQQKESETSADEDQDWRDGAQEQLIEKYVETIITGHDGGCLWRRRGCDDTIYRLPLAHQATALSNLRLRYESLIAISSDIPSTLSTPPSFTISPTSHVLSQLLHSSSAVSTTPGSTPPTGPSPPTLINHEALILALFGWQAEPSQISGLVSCPACFRRLGLWLFKSPTPPSSPSMARLDVLAEHRDYCPWINPDSQSLAPTSRPHQQKNLSSSSSGLAGWEVLLRVVNNHAQLLRGENESRPMPAVSDLLGINGDGESEGGGAPGEVADTKARDARDTERWAKLKKLKQVFHVKRGKSKGKGGENKAMENSEVEPAS